MRENGINLYVLKSDEGYMKCSPTEDIRTVSLEKASVFPEDKLKDVTELKVRLEQKGCTNVRIAKLYIKEYDYFLEKGL